ncbi:MAG: DUF5067 domain-containing protein [Eubacteriales bacterium]|nr:DUF5067 domain-containing protein [Eubacteriales bacterium]
MKRILSVFCIIAVFFCFASCGSSKNMTVVSVTPQPAVPSEQASAPEIPSAVPSAQEAAGVLTSQLEELPSEKSAPLPIVTPVPLQNSAPAEIPAQSPAVQDTGSKPAADASSGCVAEGGGYSIEVLSAKKDQDYTGADVVVVAFKFTNNNPEETPFSHVANIRVTQNGKVLEGDGVVMDQSTFDGLGYNFTKAVKSGQSIKCVYGYLTSSSDPVDVSVEIYNDFLNRKVLGSASCSLNIG